MTRYLALSGGLHLTLALLIMYGLGIVKPAPHATYTIDFIGTGKVVSMQAKQAPEAAAVQAAAQKEVAQPPAAQEQAPAPKPTKKSYDSKTEIAAKKQPAKKKEPVPLAGPSILDEPDTPPAAEPAASDTEEEGSFEGGNIQTDFATFPYPWYITQVRNSLWSEWEKRRPAGDTLGAMISFAIARDGKITDLKIVKSSHNDSFDFAAKSAVINAGPFPPLPMLYEKDELTVTVEFKQEK